MQTARIGAAPVLNGSLWRKGKNIVRLTFACDITQPSSGNMDIRDIQPNGGFGDTNQSSAFTYTVENDVNGKPRILRINETGETLHHRTWYGIRNVGGWTGVEQFEVDYLLQMGDADANKVVTSIDVSLVNGSQGSGKPDDSRVDINGDTFTNSLDVSITNSYNPSGVVTKPSGH